MLVILQSGQTGVERGAYRGASSAGLALAGFMPVGGRDELGPIPPEIKQHLTECFERGPRSAVSSNIAIASGVIIVVPDRERVGTYTGMGVVLTAIRAAKIPWVVIDPHTDLNDAAQWIRTVPETSGSTRVFVTGPRGTRWPEGERLAMRVVASLA